MSETNSLTGLLAFFFYEHGHLSIPNLGRMELSGDSSPQTDENHLHTFPKGSISFIPNPSENLDPELVEYITSRTRKMEALAVADLNSISDVAKEMLNMRQSYTFPGIATITPDFRQHFIVTPEKLLSAPHHPKKQASADIFRQDVKENPLQGNEIHSAGAHRTFGGAIIVIICVLIVAALVYFLFLNKEGSTSHMVANTDKSTMTPRHSAKPASPDTLASNMKHPALSDNGLLTYEVVFEQADSARAFRRYTQLTGWGHKIILTTTDSVHYSLAVPITGIAADTAHIKDSIRVLYGHPVYIRHLSSG